MKKHIPSIAWRLFLCIMAEQHNNTHIKRILKKRRAWKNCWINKNKISNNFNSRQNSPHVSTLHSTIYTQQSAQRCMMMPTTLCCCSASLSFHRSLMLCVVSIFQVDGGFLSVLPLSCGGLWSKCSHVKGFFFDFSPPTTHSASSTRATRTNARKHHKSLHYALLFCVLFCAHCSPKKKTKRESILFIHF